MTFDDIPVGGCYRTRRGGVRKKVSETRYVTKKKGRVRKGTQRAAMKVQPHNCSIELIGVGLSGQRRLVEMGRKHGR